MCVCVCVCVCVCMSICIYTYGATTLLPLAPILDCHPSSVPILHWLVPCLHSQVPNPRHTRPGGLWLKVPCSY